MEATCLAGLALGSASPGNAVSTVRFLKKSQLSDGGWPAFQGDSGGAWTTALALCALSMLNEISEASDKALRWLLESRGKEGYWFWRWKFKTADLIAQMAGFESTGPAYNLGLPGPPSMTALPSLTAPCVTSFRTPPVKLRVAFIKPFCGAGRWA